jgi:hypothetical protein
MRPIETPSTTAPSPTAACSRAASQLVHRDDLVIL